MKNIGILKNVDSLGRIVILKGYRDYFGFAENQAIEFIALKEGILLRKPQVNRQNFQKNK